MMFTWLILNNKLLTTDNLIKRGWIIPNICHMCKQDQGTSRHLFTTCSTATQLRQYIVQTLPATSPQCHNYTDENPNTLLLSPTENSQWRQLELTTNFVLWRERCRRLFADKEQNIPRMAREVLTEKRSWFANGA
jgi:zinc-binding in reverse transcriptase